MDCEEREGAGVECEHNGRLVEMVKTGKKIAVEDVRENFEGDGSGWLMCLIGLP